MIVGVKIPYHEKQGLAFAFVGRSSPNHFYYIPPQEAVKLGIVTSAGYTAPNFHYFLDPDNSANHKLAVNPYAKYLIPQPKDV